MRISRRYQKKNGTNTEISTRHTRQEDTKNRAHNQLEVEGTGCIDGWKIIPRGSFSDRKLSYVLCYSLVQQGVLRSSDFREQSEECGVKILRNSDQLALELKF